MPPIHSELRIDIYGSKLHRKVTELSQVPQHFGIQYRIVRPDIAADWSRIRVEVWRGDALLEAEEGMTAAQLVSDLKEKNIISREARFTPWNITRNPQHVRF